MTTTRTTRSAVLSGLAALSVARPWAALIAQGHKPVENRGWFSRYRGTLVIHASQRWDRYAADLPPLVGLSGAKTDHPTGYLGLAEVVDVHHADLCGGCSPWAEPGCWHWVLTTARPFPAPIPGPGQRGLYVPPDPILTHISDQIVRRTP